MDYLGGREAYEKSKCSCFIPSVWDNDFDPYFSLFHDDHSYADKDARKKFNDLNEELKGNKEWSESV